MAEGDKVHPSTSRKTRGNHTYHSILCPVVPTSFGEDEFLTGARWCLASFSQLSCFSYHFHYEFKIGRCERVLRFMGREVQGRQKFRMQTVKWAVAKLQGDKAASFCREMSGREATGR